MAKKAQQSVGGDERISLVVYRNEHANVEWSIPNGRARQHCQLPACEDKPKASFVDAFEALTPIALEIAELRDPSWIATAHVTKLHIGYDEKSGRRSYIMTVQRTLEHGVIVFNTPIRLERLEPATEIGAGFASDALRAAASAVALEAIAFIRGVRDPQGKLALVEAQTPAGDGDAES